MNYNCHGKRQTGLPCGSRMMKARAGPGERRMPPPKGMVWMSEKLEFMIVVDMQNDFVSGSLGSEMARAIVPDVAEAVERFISEDRGRLIFTKDTHEENYMETSEGRHLPIPHCVRGTWGNEIIPELAGYASREGAVIVEKKTFGSVGLPGIIRAAAAEDKGEKSADGTAGESFAFYLLGLCTDICVVSNALLLKANFPEASFRVDSRCCAGVTRKSHEAALETMKMCHIEVV